MVAFQANQWFQNYKNRTDLTGLLTHLTRPNELNKNPTDVLVKIFNDQRLISSSMGYITGGNRVICFQDIPLYSVAQNSINHIEKYESNQVNKLRYYPCGLAFPMASIGQLVNPDTLNPIQYSGARPVIYEKSDVAKKFLPVDQYWRIVDFDISGVYKGQNITDWTHEREWRMLGDLKIIYNNTIVILMLE